MKATRAVVELSEGVADRAHRFVANDGLGEGVVERFARTARSALVRRSRPGVAAEVRGLVAHDPVEPAPEPIAGLGALVQSGEESLLREVLGIMLVPDQAPGHPTKEVGIAGEIDGGIEGEAMSAMFRLRPSSHGP